MNLTQQERKSLLGGIEGQLSGLVPVQMVLMEDSGDKPTLILDRDPEGLCEIVESSNILEASHVREVSDRLMKISDSFEFQADFRFFLG